MTRPATERELKARTRLSIFLESKMLKREFDTYQELADHIGVSYTTLKAWLDKESLCNTGNFLRLKAAFPTENLDFILEV